MSEVVKVQYLIAGIFFKELLKAVVGCNSPEATLVCVQKCYKAREELSGGDKHHEHLC